MRVVLHRAGISVVPEGDVDLQSISDWLACHAGHAFADRPTLNSSIQLVDLGPHADACREPINITSRHPDPVIRLIGNFAETPFELDGLSYRSVEGFWQGLKFDSDEDRRKIALASGDEARGRGASRGYNATVRYADETIAVGTADHWALMERACRAKFTQHDAARRALCGTGARPLEHRVRRDSRAIPGVVMADLWMRIRRDLLEETVEQ